MRHSLFFLSALLVIAPIAASAAVFTDTSESPYWQDIKEMRERGLVHGYDDGTFRPTWTINRAEFLKMLSSVSPGEDRMLTDRHCFKDFTGEPEWFWLTACGAKERGIIGGYPDGTFRAANKIILAEALKMTLTAFNVPLPQYFKEPDHWYDPYIDAAASLDLADTFPKDPAHLITREEIAHLLMVLDQARADGKIPQ
jgi:hypothetical protein